VTEILGEEGTEGQKEKQKKKGVYGGSNYK
jgi:hypothetical protein